MFGGNRGHGNRHRGRGGRGNRFASGGKGGWRNRYDNQDAAATGSNGPGDSQGQGQDGGGGGSGRGQGERHPAHLRGKAIGMFYAKKGIAKEKTKVHFDLNDIDLDPRVQDEIAGLLQRFDPEITKDSFESQSLHVQPAKANFTNPNLSMDTGLVEDSDSGSYGSGYTTMFPEFLGELKRDSSLDMIMKQEYAGSKTGANARIQEFRQKLPAFKSKNDVVKLISKNQVVVISGETGCGKTTQVCQFVLDDMIEKGDGSLCNILCTQPRRISAITVAERVAEERDERIGSRSVGYVIRLENRRATRSSGTITFCTTGIVFQYLKGDPQLKRFSHIVVDEVHERSIHSDLLLTILRDIIKQRTDLKIILMSATINADHFSRYFLNCPAYNIPGLTFPVQEFYLEDIIEMTNFQFESNERQEFSFQRGGSGRKKFTRWDTDEHEYNINMHIRRLERERKYSSSTLQELAKPETEDLKCIIDLIQSLLEYICNSDKRNGAVLIFVPGWSEISKLHSQLQGSGRFPERQNLIIPLHSMMPTVNQKQVFNRPPHGVRKIIIATNIAETSVTIDDVLFVIDSGKIKMSNFNLKMNLDSLDSEWVSRANAKQRKGRAGRVQAGICYHLFSQAREKSFDDFKKPEIQRTRLEEVILELKILNFKDVGQFFSRLLDPPARKAVDLSLDRLKQLGALDEDEELTALGFHLAHLPMDPQTGKMILMGAIFSCVDPIFSIAASLSFKDGFYTPLGKEKLVDRIRKDFSDESKSDHWVTVKAMEGYEEAMACHRERDYCYRNFLSQSTCNMLISFKKQFCEHLHRMKFLPSIDPKDPRSNINSKNIALVKAVACSGMYPNVAMVRPRRPRGGPPFPILRTPEDGKVMIHPKSVNANEIIFESPFVIYHVKQKSSQIFLFDTTMISPYPLVFFGGKLQLISDKGEFTLIVDGNIRLKLQKSTFGLIQILRHHLETLLEQKINTPMPTDWSLNSKEGQLLRAIRTLMTAEYNQLMNLDNCSTASDSDNG